MVTFPDEEVLAYCISQKRILLTLNRRDFIRLHNKKIQIMVEFLFAL